MKILCFDIDSSSIAYDLSTRQVTMNAETNSAKDATDFSAKVRAGEYSDRQSYNRIMVDGVKENGPIMTTSFIYLEDVVVRGDNSDFSWQFIEYEGEM